MDQKTPTPAEILIMAGGAVAIVGSFLKFIGSGDFGASSWASGNFPVVTLMSLFALIMAVQIAVTKFGGVNLPDRVLGFTWPQIHLILGFFAALYAVAFLLVNTAGDKKIGFWLVLIGCVAAFVGAIMLQKERGTTGTAGPGTTSGPGTV